MVCFQTKKIPIWVNFGGPSNGKCLYILWSFGIFYGHLEYFTVIGYILWPFGNVVVIRYIFPRFGILCLVKSGNPALMLFQLF
jgi:hypothetical protein